MYFNFDHQNKFGIPRHRWDRHQLLQGILESKDIDILIVGGGATGLGVALDGISRGFKVALLEMADFGKGTSGKSTKLLHGGVRYLQKGDVSLVIEALREREFVLNHAPHLSQVQEFIIPYYSVWKGWYYWMGLRLYDLLAASKSLGKTRRVKKREVLNLLPNIVKKGLKGGILYTDGQFDDTRLCIDLVSTINQSNSYALNYIQVNQFKYDDQGMMSGVEVVDQITGKDYIIHAKSVVNTTGVFAEETMMMDDGNLPIKIIPARGSHIVVDRSFLQSDQAIMIPKTSDSRVLFIIPWKTVVIMGTTDVESDLLTLEPKATDSEIEFILRNAAQYLEGAPGKEDILSTFAGLRPLAAPKKEGRKSKEISRSHKIIKSKNGLFSVLGGKWTTFRKMGQDTVDAIIKAGRLPHRKSRSLNMNILHESFESGADSIHPDLPYTWSELEKMVRTEWVVHAEDLLCRRTRCMILNKEATLSILDKAIELIAVQRNMDDRWKIEERKRFMTVATAY